MFDIIIIGGGAAGFYAAIHTAEANPSLKIAILERGKSVLSKVKVSGGGRCNVTHAEFDPGRLVKNYPRGEKELLGPFHTHCSGDTAAFFEERGVKLKIEEDGRMFPLTDSSQTIIDFFLDQTASLGIRVLRHSAVTDLEYLDFEKNWQVTTIKKRYRAKKILVATGSNAKIWDILQRLGHTIEPPVPSLFTFNIEDARIAGISGLSTNAAVKVLPLKAFHSKVTIALRSQMAHTPLLSSEGPLLITHWGMSGPAVLRLSAWGARVLNKLNYRFAISVNWLPEFHEEAVISLLIKIKDVEAKKTVLRTKVVDVPRRLWMNLVKAAQIPNDMKWAEVSKGQLQELADQLTNSRFLVNGKSVFKEEFVTAGGVDLKEINFKTFESKLCPNLFFAGEVINIDAITGGFNFQNAWTGGYISAQAMAKE